MNQTHGKGAIPLNRFHRYLRRKLRVHKNDLGKASVPFDWVNGYSSLTKIGPVLIKDQGQSDSCGGQAGAYAVEILRGLLNVNENISAKSIYAPIAYPGGGTTVAALETQIATAGADLESEVPSYDANGNPLSEAMMTEQSWKTPAMLMSAMKRAGFTPISVDIDIDSIAEAIRDNGFTIWEIRGKNEPTGSWLQAYPIPPQAGNPNPFWAHFMCQFGAETVNQLQQINSFQSWGINVGDAGKQYFRNNYIDSGYIVDVFTFVPDANIPPTATNFFKQWATWFLNFMS